MTGNNNGSVIVVRQKDLRTDRRIAQCSVLASYSESKSTRLIRQVIPDSLLMKQQLLKDIWKHAHSAIFAASGATA